MGNYLLSNDRNIPVNNRKRFDCSKMTENRQHCAEVLAQFSPLSEIPDLSLLIQFHLKKKKEIKFLQRQYIRSCLCMKDMDTDKLIYQTSTPQKIYNIKDLKRIVMFCRLVHKYVHVEQINLKTDLNHEV